MRGVTSRPIRAQLLMLPLVPPLMLLGGLASVLALAACSEEPEPAAPEVPAGEYCEGVADWDPAHAALELEVVAEINARRVEGGNCGGEGDFEPAAAVVMDAALRCAARRHTAAMVEADSVEHEIPDGDSFAVRAAAAGFDGEALGQSVGAGSRPDPAQIVTTWLANDGSCANLLNPEATAIGVGYLPAAALVPEDEASYAHWWTAVFGAE